MQQAETPPRRYAPIVAANIDVAAAIYFAAMLEATKLFDVVDRLVELFSRGQLPIRNGNAARLLRATWSSAGTRLSAAERRDIYARALGVPGGAGGSTPNRGFDALWRRFVSVVAAYDEGAHVCEAARDLAVNATRAGGAVAPSIAPALRAQIADMVTILSDPEVRSAYGARDMWQVVDQVATLELGGAAHARRYRTMAVSGSTIFGWLAQQASGLASGHACSAGLDIVDASERWLAAAAEADSGAQQRG